MEREQMPNNPRASNSRSISDQHVTAELSPKIPIQDAVFQQLPTNAKTFDEAAAARMPLTYPDRLGPAIEFSVDLPKLLVRAPTALDKEQWTDEPPSSPYPSIGSSPGESSRDSTTLNTPPDYRLDLRYGEDPVREEKLADSEGLIDEHCRSLNEAVIGDISSKADWAARTGRGLPTRLRRDSNAKYEPSEKSNITDLGVRERSRVAIETGRHRPPQEVTFNEDDLKLPVQDRLLDIIKSVPGHDEKKGFFPEATLEAMIDERCIERELRACYHDLDSDTIKKAAQNICGHGRDNLRYKKIFVTLVLAEKPSAIFRFLEGKVSDTDLPLAKIRRTGKASIVGLALKSTPTKPLDCFREWTKLAIMRFEEWQWTTLAPFFNRSQRKKVGHWILQDQIPLPFIADSRYDDDEEAYDRLEFEGGNSTVFKVDIHPEHHSFVGPNDPNRSFAIKCLVSRNRDEFKREADTLMKFSGDAHRHLISLLATYEHHKSFYLIFPWAEAHLRDFWEDKNPSPTVDYETALWTAEQCRGIADGLVNIHHYESSHSKNGENQQLHPGSAQTRHRQDRMSKGPADKLFGRHGDLKPDNILWFRDPSDENDRGILKITDFGLTEFKTHSKFYKRKSEVAITPSYRAPECDLQEGVAGPSSDIWSLGCIYLELITWFLGGKELVQEFRERRTSFDPMFYDFKTDTFFEIVKCNGRGGITTGAMVKPSVTRFIAELRARPNAAEYIQEFLDLIQNDMLVIKSPDQRDRDRITCQEVDAELAKLLRRCKRDRDYACASHPWPNGIRDPGGAEKAVETAVARPAAEILQRKQLRVHDGPTQRRPVSDSPAVELCRELTVTSIDAEDVGPAVTKSKSV